MKKNYLFAFLLFSYFSINAQIQQFTPYDELPEINKSYKPAYSDDMPEWGKKLYSYPINFDEIDKAFVKWEAKNKDKKTPLMRYYKIWRKAIAPYVMFDGKIQTPNIEIINRNLTKFQQQSLQPQKAPAAGNSSNWTLWGPKETYWMNESGRVQTPGTAPWQANVYSFDVTDKNPNLLYCGTETGFINKSTDKGQNWTISGLNYPFGGGVGAIAIHPINLDTVLVGSGRAIHQTMDGGTTWNKVYSSGNINRMKYDYTNPQNAIACASDGIHISNNAGKTWTKTFYTDTWDVEYKPDNNNIVYALTKDNANKYMIIESENGGRNFSTITSFPDTLENHSGGLLAVTPDDPNGLLVLLLAKNNGRRPFIYRGVRDGNDWKWYKWFVGSDGAFTSGQLTNGQGYFDVVLEISPVNKNIVFVGTTSLFRSKIGGRVFSAIGGYAGSYAIHPDIQDMKILANGDTWVATDGGMNYTSDNFESHDNHLALNSMLVGSDFWGFHQGWNEDIVVGGRYHNGNTAITDFYNDKALRMGGGESATGWVIQGKSRHVVFDDLGAGWILPPTAESNPGGRFQFSKHPNMEGYGALRSNVVMHPYYSGQIYVGRDSTLWVSKDFGATFDKLYEFNGMVRYFDISTHNPDVMYVDVVGYGLYRTGDGGKTFERKNTPLNNKTGRLRFVISPYDSDLLYCTLTHGVWDNTRSEVYRSPNGGTYWLPWSTFGGNVLIKTLAIQPTTEGKDLVYAITDTYGFYAGSVFYRKSGEADWVEFNNNYPKGMRVNHALPFYRDSKLRVGGNAGVWESPFVEPEFTPVVVPWVEYKVYNSHHEPVQFDCHSYLNHKDAQWTWSITPAPKEISDIHARNPIVAFDKPGKYTVTLSVTQNGVTTSKTVKDMVELKEGVSLDDCNKPAELPRALMNVIYVDSEHSGDAGNNVLDGNLGTIWHTVWGAGETPYPHEIQIDLGDAYKVNELIYYPRTDQTNGRIKDYKVYISNDKENWGNAVATGTLPNVSTPSVISFEPTAGRYAKLVAISEVNGRNWASAAEIRFTGCRINTSTNNFINDVTLNAFPIPARNVINVSLPFQNGLNTYDVYMFSSNGQLLYNTKTNENETTVSIDVNNYPAGNYFVMLKDKGGITYRVKFIKK